MARSMTGFGAGAVTSASENVSVELKSVNHKFCEVKVRLPRELTSLEGSVTKRVKDRLVRGAVDVFVKRSSAHVEGLTPKANKALAQAYRDVFSRLAADLNLVDDIRLRDITTQSGVITLEESPLDVESASASVEAALTQALNALLVMREREGQSLVEDLQNRLATVKRLTQEVRVRSEQVVEEYRARLTRRVAELIEGQPVDPQRIAQEVALLAERTDVSEELTRLDAHCAQFLELLTGAEPSGRKLDFLVQEMHREVNTTGSKSQSADISGRVVALKAELERIREQVQNIE